MEIDIVIEITTICEKCGDELEFWEGSNLSSKPTLYIEPCQKCTRNWHLEEQKEEAKDA